MRLLLIAPTADSASVGESWIAYQWARRMSERHEVTVLSYFQRTGRRLDLQLPDARVVEWQEPPLVGRYERLNAMLNPGYIPFRRHAHRWILAALARGERFDVGHQVGPVSLRYASPLAGTGIPYVIGPVGGSLSSPPGFRDEEGGASWFTALRNLDGFRLRHDRSLRASFAGASCVIGIADYVREALATVPLRSFRTLSDTGIDGLPEQARGSERTREVRLLFVGRVIRTKGVRDAIRALALIPARTARLDVVGEGYDREACEALVDELGLTAFVTFHGRVSRDRVTEFYLTADIFVFPSYREAGGIAVVEAMSHGLPVIVCNRGGPAATVDSSSGIKVDAIDPTQYAQDLAEPVARLAGDPEERRRLGAGARQRIESSFLWTQRVEWMEALYGEVTTG